MDKFSVKNRNQLLDSWDDSLIEDLIFSDNSSAFLSVNLLFEIISFAIDNSKRFTISSIALANFNLNSCFKSSGTSILIEMSVLAINEFSTLKYLNISGKENEKRVVEDITPEVRDFFQNYNYNNYLNIIKENKEVAVISHDNEAKLASFILADINIYKDNNYLNFSINTNNAGDAPEAKLASHLSHKQGPSRHSGSIPGWGAPPASFSHSIKSEGGWHEL